MFHRNHLGAQPDPAGTAVHLEQRPGDLRVRTLDAMIATAAHRGYDRTTVERVLQTADIPAAVFDEHFANKEDCFLQALDALIARMQRRVLKAVRRVGPWPERVRLGLGALLEALAEDPDGARVLLVECLGASPAASERPRALFGVFPPLLEEGRLHCANPDHLPPGTPEAMVGGIAAILHRRALEDRTGELPRLCGDLTYFALLPYLGHQQAIVVAYAKEPISRR